MTNGRFQILLRRMQIMAPYPTALDPVVPVIVHCAPLTGFAEYIPGTVDNVTPFEDITPVNGWYDFSGMSPEGHQYIEPDFKLSFTWDKVNSGDSTNTSTSQDGSNYDKGITSDFTFFDAAYRFIYAWLLSTECQILNAVEVKIIDLIARANGADPAGNYRLFEIKSDNLEYAPIDAPCQFHVKLREQDLIWHCIHKTVIWDDWQGWFQSGGFNHPTFLTCIEPRPRLINSARMALLLFYYSNPSIAAINFLIPGNIRDDARKILNANRFVDAPLVLTYIQNVAGKCNMTYDTIFDPGQPLSDVCLYFPQAGFMYENDDDTISPSQAFTYDNRWLITIADLLDKLKIVFAAEWYVTPNNTIVFKHIKDLLNLAPIYDFTAVGAEPIYDLKYSFNGTKKPAYGRYEYTDDGSDLASQEMDTLYNDIVDYDGPANNPMLEGERVKNFEFAPTGFVRDGRAKDYLKLLIHDGQIGALILLAIIFILIGVLAAGVLTAGAAIALGIIFGLWLTAIFLNTTSLNQEFVFNPTYTGAVRLTSEQTLQPRLLLWDGISLQTAKTEARVGMPIPNPYYNPALTPYNEKNQIQQDNPSAIVYNYPLYFDGDYYDNLFPLYHDPIDNPLKSLETHQDVSFSVDLCVDMLNLFGVFENQYAQIGKIVKLEHRDNYDVFVRIGNINVDYDANKIYIKGIVIRRKQDQVDTENEGNIPVVIPEESAGPPPADEPCMKWTNNGDTDALVSYVDCNNNTIIDVIILPGGEFCSIQIISVTGGNIQTSTTCAESGSVVESGSGTSGGGSSAATICNRYINISADTATGVSYIDCDGNLVAGVDIGFMETFCANEIINYGSCGNIIKGETCAPCAPCCTPTIISVSIGTTPVESGSGSGSGSGACIPIGTFDFTLPDAIFCGETAYEHTVSLDTDGATPPFDLVITSKPAWLNITIVDNEIVFSGTPSAVADFVEVNFTITNCDGAGLQEVGTFIRVINGVDAGPDKLVIAPGTTANISGSTIFTGGTYLWTTSGDGTFDDDTILTPVYTVGAGDISAGSAVLTLTVSGSSASCPDVSDTMTVYYSNFNIQPQIQTPSDGFVLNPFTQVGVGVNVVVDWADGSPLEFFPYTGANVLPVHTYATAGTYSPVFYYTADSVTSFFEVDANIKVLFLIPNNITNLSVLSLEGVMDIDNILLFVAPVNVTTISLVGHPDSTETTADLSALPASLKSLTLQLFPALTQISNAAFSGTPPTLDHMGLISNPVLNDIDSSNTYQPLFFASQNDNSDNPISYPTFDFTRCTTFIVQGEALTTTEVNNYLIALDANGLNNGFCELNNQTPAAPPSGAGATAKTNLIGKGWTVNTD